MIINHVSIHWDDAPEVGWSILLLPTFPQTFQAMFLRAGSDFFFSKNWGVWGFGRCFLEAFRNGRFFWILTASASDYIFVCGGVLFTITMSYLVPEFVWEAQYYALMAEIWKKKYCTLEYVCIYPNDLLYFWSSGPPQNKAFSLQPKSGSSVIKGFWVYINNWMFCRLPKRSFATLGPKSEEVKINSA